MSGTQVPLLPIDAGKIETLAVLRKEAQARQVLAELKGFAPAIPNQNILINAIVLQEAQESTAIENIITTQDELYKNLAIQPVNMNISAKEVLNYRKAVYQGYAIIKERDIISVSDIVRIQETIVENNAGIRKLPGTSLVNSATNEIIFTPPQDYEEICYLLSNFCSYLNNEENSLWKMAVLHYQFETIHPFYDGNGRTGRILNILYLLLKRFIDTPVLYLSSYIIKTKNRYYGLFQEVREKDIWENWILYILDGIEETAKHTLEKVKSIKILLESTQEIIKEQYPKLYSKELVEVIFENPYSKIDFLAKKLQVNRKTASKYLKELEKANILSHIQIGKEKVYINDALMAILA
ncbi:MAG: Fic family protein [Treponema sp.]|nr:Fic family protein [Treponema sp.]